MDTTAYHRDATAARQERDATINAARLAERRAYAATRCYCVYPAECRCSERVTETHLYAAAFHTMRAIEDSAERTYQQRLAEIAEANP